MTRVLVSTLIGAALTLLSTFAGERSATATYPDIMGCETGCPVVATGWPLIFVRDYTGMSVVHTADIMEVWFAADQLDWVPFLLNVIFWSLLCFAAMSYLMRRTRPEAA
jgi:ABC-type enterobactin transport system permease subunit